MSTATSDLAVDGGGPHVAPVLALEGVHAGYGQFQALFGLSIEVPPGHALAIVGHNGMGKTTVARVASGLIVPTKGRVLVDGQDFTGRGAQDFVRAGVAHAPEGRSVFATLSVQENLTLAFRKKFGRKGVSSWSLQIGRWSWNSRTRAHRVDLPGPLSWKQDKR